MTKIHETLACNESFWCLREKYTERRPDTHLSWIEKWRILPWLSSVIYRLDLAGWVILRKGSYPDGRVSGWQGRWCLNESIEKNAWKNSIMKTTIILILHSSEHQKNLIWISATDDLMISINNEWKFRFMKFCQTSGWKDRKNRKSCCTWSVCGTHDEHLFTFLQTVHLSQ